MDDFQPPPPNARGLPAADLTASAQTSNVEYEAFPVRKPEEDLNDFKLQVRASTLTRCRTRLAQISNVSFPWHELALGVGTLAAGVYLGTIPAEIKPETAQSTVFNTIMPAVAASALVAYFFLRRGALVDPVRAASDVLSELPDPTRSR